MTREFELIDPEPEEVKPAPRPRKQGWFSRWYARRKFAPAFWNITGTLSLVVNLILIVVLIVVADQLFALRAVVSDQLINGLHENFVKMDQSVIATTIQVNDTIMVNDTIPVQFLLPLETETNVVLTQNTSIKGASVTIITPFFTLNNAPTDIILPAGTVLPVELNLDVPVDTTIPVVLTVPVNLSVPVNIPLNQTDLHVPFTGLQNVVGPYKLLLDDTPTSWNQALCGEAQGSLCANLVGDR